MREIQAMLPKSAWPEAGANQQPRGGEPAESDVTLRRSTDLETATKHESDLPKATARSLEPRKDEFLVTLDGRSHLNPHTWGKAYRWVVTFFAGSLVLNATFASSAPSNLLPSIERHFHISEEVGTLLISIFVAGYCFGPLLWGPLSEGYGRKRVFVLVWVPYFGFQIGCALSKNIGSLLAFRFLGGAFGSAPLANSGGVISDLWGPEQRGDALAVFSLMPLAGPALAPIISGYLEVTGTNWRWIFWVLTIYSGVCFVGIVFVLPETYVPYLLHREAKRLRKETGNAGWYAPMDAKRESFQMLLNRTVLKPFRLAIEEPMLLTLSVYMSFLYALVYMLFEIVPLIFIGEHGLNSGEAGLVFLALVVGSVIGVLLYVFYFNKQYQRYHHSLNGKPVPPEYRLIPLMWSAPFLAVAFFWIGWTSYPSVSIASPIVAIVLLGACVLFIFLAIFNYIIDCYLANAASALSFNTVLRSTFGAGFPLFTKAMFDRLGTPGACSLLGGIAIVFVPVPFLLYKYGKKIRAMSKNAVMRPGEESA